MKKRFTFLIAAIAAILMMAQPVKVVGQTRTEVTTTFTSGSSYSAGMTLPNEDGGLEWVTSAKPNSFESASPARGIQYSKVSTNITHTISNASVTKVVVVASTNANANVNSISVYVGETQIGSTQNMPKENNKTYTFETNTGQTGEIKVSMSNDGSRSTYIKSITVTYTTGGSTPSINASNVNITANETSGSIIYSIDNGVDGGAVTSAVVTASEPSDWLIVNGSNQYSSPIGLTCEANTGASAKTATVQLTYTYNTDQTVTKNVSVTQSAPTYNITYNANGATSGTVPTDETNYTSGTQARVKANTGNLAKTGYYWTGWNTAANGSGTPYTSYDKFNITDNTTLYAQWASTSVTYTVSSTSAVSSSGTVPANSSATFSNTYSGNDACQMTGNNSMTLTLSGYKNQIIKGIVLSMHSNSSGGRGYMSAVVGGSTTIASFGSSGNNNDKTFNGDWYTGWSTSYVNIPITLSNANYVIQQSEDLVITINATANSLYCESFTLLYETSSDPIINADDVEIAYDETSGEIPYTITNSTSATLTAKKTTGDWISEVTVDGENSKVRFTTTTTNTGVGREGTITLSYTGASDKVVKVYQEAQKYTVTYAGNGGTGSMTDSNSPYEYGAEVTLLDNTFTAPSGKMFNGWLVTEGSSNPVSVSDGKFTMPKSDVTVTAQWRDKLKYALVTNINQLIPGKHYIFVGKDGENYYAMGKDRGNNRLGIGVSVDGEGKIAETTGLYEFVISGSSADYWTIYDSNTLGLNEGTDKTGYLYAAGGTSSNYLKTQTTNDNKGQWSITIASETNLATIQANISTANARKYMQYNHNGGNPDLFSCYKDNDANVYIYVRDGDNDCEINSATTISSGTTTISGDMNIVSGIVTIQDGATLKVNGTLTNTTAANLIIEDGGQLIIPDNTKVKATVQKATAGSSAEKTEANNLYAISSPVDGIEISSFAQGYAPSGAHNVYQYYEPTSTWQEYRNASNKFDNLAIGRGYLYRSSVENIELAGDVTGGDKDGEVEYTLSYAYGVAKYKGLNLVGNPFTHNITWSNLDLTNVEEGGCYVLNEDPENANHGKWQAVVSGIVTVKPMQAFFVQATAGSASITFKNTVGGGDKALNYANDNIMLSVKNGKCSDEAYVLFKEGHGLNKIEHRNAEIPMLYVMDNGQNFAIADMSDDTRAINLGFEAKTIGQYTISLKSEGQYGHMSLYDKVTNTETDMLLEDSYTFVGAPNDRKDRFVLNLNYNAANINTDSDIFAYQSGSDIIIRGDGELHVFDVMGRLVLTQRVNGVETISMQSQGVYIFKLNGMTQKIVVK